MLQRLTHAAISFAIVVAVYQVYVLVAVPFLEPQWSGQAVAQSSTPGQHVLAHTAPHKYRELLAAYFPADHWSLREPPKTFENGQTMVVLDDYHPQDNGQVRVDRLVLLFFPHPRVPGSVPPRDAMVLEAPHGAVLQMDKSLRGGPTTGVKMQWGKLPGKIILRSDMRDRGPQDDFYLVTHDLHITEHMIRTDAEVEMRLGPHKGHGRELEIRLLPSEQAGGGLSLGGIESLEITHDVAAIVVPGKNSLLLSSDSTHSIDRVPVSQLGLDNPGVEVPVEPSGPIQVTSRGPFSFDFASYIGSFVDQVRVVQTHAGGLQDEIHGDELNLFFALDRLAQAGGDQDVKKLPLSGIHPAMIEVKGTPVRIDAPGREVTVRCERMRVEIEPRRATFDGQDEVMLQYRGSEIHAPMVWYQHPPEGSIDHLGTMLAAGNGWLHAVTNLQRAHESLEVRWSESLRLGREDGQPVLTIEGRPKITMVGLGEMRANEVKLYLREQVAGSSPLPAVVVPDRLLAEGLVAIESAELTGRVHHLAVWMDYDSRSSAVGNLTLGNANGSMPKSLRNSLTGGQAAGTRSYGISGNRLRLQITVRNRRPVVTTVSVDGSVEFREKSGQGGPAEPLVIRADQLRIDKADTPEAKINIMAAPAQGGPANGWGSGGVRQPTSVAEVSVRGMTIRAASLELNRGTSRVWIGSPGELEMLMDRDLQGQPLATPQPMTITWQKSMELDQDHITFLHQVMAVGNGGRLRTARLIARLSTPVRFDGALQQQQPELVQLECWDGVTAAFQQQDAGGVVSQQRLEMKSLVANLQTGRLEGDGPGWIKSVHLATSSSFLAMGSGNRLPGNGSQTAGLVRAKGLAQATGPVQRGPIQRLRFLRVDFVRGIHGNLIHREVQAMGQVKAIYGPVDSWQQQLQMSLQKGPGEHTVWISSDQLGVFENPLARLQQPGRSGSLRSGGQPPGALELVAEGHVIIEGKAPQQGDFTARAARATYDQQKTMFVLEGDPATLTRQPFVGGPPSESSAQKLIYRHSTGELKIEGLRRLQWNQFDMGRKPPQKVPR
jgi:hypothetical protein